MNLLEYWFWKVLPLCFVVFFFFVKRAGKASGLEWRHVKTSLLLFFPFFVKEGGSFKSSPWNVSFMNNKGAQNTRKKRDFFDWTLIERAKFWSLAGTQGFLAPSSLGLRVGKAIWPKINGLKDKEEEVSIRRVIDGYFFLFGKEGNRIQRNF